MKEGNRPKYSSLEEQDAQSGPSNWPQSRIAGLHPSSTTVKRVNFIKCIPTLIAYSKAEILYFHSPYSNEAEVSDTENVTISFLLRV